MQHFKIQTTYVFESLEAMKMTGKFFGNPVGLFSSFCQEKSKFEGQVDVKKFKNEGFFLMNSLFEQNLSLIPNITISQLFKKGF